MRAAITPHGELHHIALRKVIVDTSEVRSQRGVRHATIATPYSRLRLRCDGRVDMSVRRIMVEQLRVATTQIA